ncbi:hypothetical protein ACFQ1E_20230 [Sphingomonas canadensis]|uniref:DUF1036 domain-containing protein n=1 Tax=Sphingomonas canadensis TaxID=1219257 RepID=A0ABW3HBS2_9SPHN|nr:hypothetical protein [Sphingomonas canadensis]MCW3838414.1 hypothetical protein [Sphingomonas canadensis]
MRTPGKWMRAAALAGCLAQAGTAQAQAIYTGNCERARMLQREQTASSLVHSGRYQGVLYLAPGIVTNRECKGGELLHVYYLDGRQVDGDKVRYKLKIKVVDLPYEKTGCTLWQSEIGAIFGDFEFHTEVREENGLCGFYLRGEWRYADTGKPGDMQRWTADVLMTGSRKFSVVMVEGDGITPIAFTAIRG